MRKCVVVADAIQIVVGKDSIVNVSEQQYELARYGLKPLEEKKEAVKEVVEQPSEEVEEVKEKKTSKKKGK